MRRDTLLFLLLYYVYYDYISHYGRIASPAAFYSRHCPREHSDRALCGFGRPQSLGTICILRLCSRHYDLGKQYRFALSNASKVPKRPHTLRRDRDDVRIFHTRFYTYPAIFDNKYDIIVMLAVVALDISLFLAVSHYLGYVVPCDLTHG